MMTKIADKALRFFQSARVAAAVNRGVPVPFNFRGREYFVNPERAAWHHISNSTLKIANLADLVDPEASVIFDVGGNCGLFSAFAALSCPGASIHCFEPSPTLLPIIRLNARDPRIQIYGNAVGDQNERIPFFINKDSEQTNSFNKEAVDLFAKPGNVSVREVDCVTLDRFVSENGIRAIDVLKVDVQGFEGAVFRGARSILPSVKMLFVESTWMDIESIVEMIPFALDNGFTHAAVINPVHMGADILLSRSSVKGPAVKLSFEISSQLLGRKWR